MPTVVLRNSQGRDVAFLLVSGKASLAEGGVMRDCVFMQLPLPMVPPEAAFFAERKHIEFSAQIQNTSEETVVEFEAGSGARFSAALSPGGDGRWRVQQESASRLEGLCAILPAKS